MAESGRRQLFTFLYTNCDVKTISSPKEIEQDRYLVFSHPFDDWVFDCIIEKILVIKDRF